MKKYLIYSLFGAATLSMASCNEDFNDVAAPQEWAQEEAITLPNLSLTGEITLDLGEAGDSITLFNPSLSGALPEGGELKNFTIEINGLGYPEEFQKTLKASNQGKVATAELQAIGESIFGKRPEAHGYELQAFANIVVNGQASLLKSNKARVSITVAAPQISKNYYLIGAPSAWEPTCVTMPFNHSGKDVYEDPIFTIVFPVSDGETWFAVADDITVETADWKQVFGCAEGNGANGEEGVLKRRADLTDDGSFKVVVDGDAKFIKMTLNMMEYTYKIEKLNFEEYIYVPGNHQGWAPDKAPRLHGANSDGKYVGYSCLDGGFKFTKGPGWNFGEYNWGSFTSHPEGFTGEGGGDITCTVKGFYLIEADVATGTLKATPTTWGIIGDATANGWDSDQDMTWNAEKHCWCATITLTDGTIKFRANDGWDINFGGNPDNLSAGGADIPVTAGTYDIDLYLERTTSENIYCTMTKK